MRVVNVKASTPYRVFIGHGLMERCGALMAEAIAPCRAAVVCDERVADLYLRTVRGSLAAAGYAPCAHVFPGGEPSKSLAGLESVLGLLAREGITRSDAVVALGGGVTGDLAGFAAAVWLRGVRYVQMPTTLLAQVDSSVGGKTAVNLPAGKNLAGAFHQPSLVLCDADALRTLPPAEFSQGMAEVIKYGAALDEPLLRLAALPERDMQAVVERCVRLKAGLVEADELDTGARQLLNFGHTVGHAVERLSGYRLPHGAAVGIGMAVIARASRARGLCGPEVPGAIEEALALHGLPARCPYQAAEVAQACLQDKKRSGGAITLVVPRALGACALHAMDVSQLPLFLAAGLA